MARQSLRITLIAAVALLGSAACAQEASRDQHAPETRVVRIVSPAMAPTLEPGNITVDLFTDSAEVADVLRPGDIVMYAWPIDTVKEFLHRVVGAPGDTLMMVGGVLHRNGRTEQEPYAWHEQPGQSPEVPEMAWMRDALVRGAAMASPRRNDWGPIVLPPGHWFVLGDNRDNALDSRYWGFVPTSHIRGRPQRSGER